MSLNRSIPVHFVFVKIHSKFRIRHFSFFSKHSVGISFPTHRGLRIFFTLFGGQTKKAVIGMNVWSFYCLCVSKLRPYFP